MKCKLCGGWCHKLGSLGFLNWFRCRNCGMEWNKKVKTNQWGER